MKDQEQFIDWLSKKLKVKSPSELKLILQKMGEAKVKEQYDLFQKESGGESFEDQENNSTSIPMSLQGGKLDYLKCLELFKKGGKIGCGCSGKKMEKGGQVLSSDNKISAAEKGSKLNPSPNSKAMAKDGIKIVGGKNKINPDSKAMAEKGRKIPKAQIGAIMSGITKGASMATTAAKAAKAAKTAATMAKIAKGINTAAKVVDTAKPFFASKQTNQVQSYAPTAVGVVNPNEIPNGVTFTTPPKSGNFNGRSIPTIRMEKGGEMDSKVNKLKALKNKKK